MTFINYRNLLFTVLLAFTISHNCYTQTMGIGTDFPDASTHLDIVSTDKGMLGPRISLSSANVFQLNGNTQTEGIFLYNSNTSTTNGNGKGYYVWTGIKWEKMGGDHDWYTVGTSTSPNSISDNIYTNGNVGIGASDPQRALVVNGDIVLGNVTSGGWKNIYFTRDINGSNDGPYIRGEWEDLEFHANRGNGDAGGVFRFFSNTNPIGAQQRMIIDGVGDVGIGTMSNPDNKLVVEGYIKPGDQNSGDNDNEGAMRYNSSKKCMEFYNGTTWKCIGEPNMQTFIIRDGINQTWDGGGSNLTNWHTGGYGLQNNFTVNDVRPNAKILFLIEMVSGTGDRRANGGFNSSYKLYGNGIWQEFDQVLTGNDEAQTQVIWGVTNNANIGNLNFTYESNGHYCNVKITAITF